MHDEGGVWAPSRRRLTTGLVLTVTLVAFESLAVSAVMPDVKDDLGLGLYGWVFSGFFLASLLGIVLAGRACDRHSATLPFAVGLAVFAGGLVVAGAAPSMEILVLARVAQGFGGGAIPAVAYASVGRGYPAAVRPRVFAVFSTAWILPGVIGPATATAISEAVSWRLVFLGLLPFVAVAAALTLPALRTAATAPEGGAEHLDPRGVHLALLLVAGTGMFLAGSSWLVLPLIVAGAVVAVWSFLRLVPAGTARLAPGMPAAIGVRGLLTFAFFGTNAFVTLALEDVHGESTAVASIALTATTFTWTAAAWVQQWAVHRVGPRRLVALGFVALAVGTIGMQTALGDTPVALPILLWGVGGFGTGLAYAPLSVTVLAAAPPGQEGASGAALQLTDVLGVALGTGLAGAFVEVGDQRSWATGDSLSYAFAMTAVVAAIGLVASRRLPVRLPAS